MTYQLASYINLTDIKNDAKKISVSEDSTKSTPQRVAGEIVKKFNESNADIQKIKEQIEKSSS